MKYRPIIVLAMAAVLLSGCVPAVPPSSENPAPAPTPTPTARADQSFFPQTVFAGDCSLLLDSSAAAQVAGGPVELAENPHRFHVSYTAITQLGGVDCVWESEEPSGSVVGAVVIPVAALVASASADTPCVDGDYCAISEVSSGFRLTGFISSNAAAAEKTAGLETLRAAFRSAVAKETPAPAYSIGGAWAIPIDCTALDPSRALGTALGDPSAVGELIVLNEPDLNSGFSTALESAPVATCAWFAPVEDASVVVRTLSGGAWVEDALASAPGAERIQVSGVDSVVLLDNLLSVFVGVNRLTVEVRSNDDRPTLESLVPAAAAIAAGIQPG